MAIMMGSLQSAGNGLSSSTALVDDGALSSADCDDHAWPTSQQSSPRYAMAHMYCMASKDTGAPDSFPGSLSSAKDMMCLLQSSLTFDGQSHDVTLAKSTFQECFAANPNAGEILAGIPDTGVPVKIVAGLGSQNPVNTSGTWDAGMKLTIPDMNNFELSVLVKDSDGILAVGVNQPPGEKTIPADAYIVTIDKNAGTIRYESKFQRIRTADGGGSNGWNRHSRILLKGVLGSDMKFTSVTEAQGAYSSIWSTSTSANDITSSSRMWTVTGTPSAGFASKYYPLSVTTAPQLAASWTPVVDACNGKDTSAATCTSTPLSLTDSGTEFMMIPGATGFVNSEDWFKASAPLSYSSVTLTQ